ncbi:MAG: tetratricopeptide repeat protein [Synergistaceae bacterium]|jgi:Tfp pilus assembly protein PilF|nr:tetratricopeptide repeat protein [Synergistaceae bacterium]
MTGVLKKMNTYKTKLLAGAFVLFAVFLCAVFGAAFSPVFAATGENDALLERAKNLYSIQDYTQALVLFTKVLEREPAKGEAWDYASWCQRYLGNWETAREGFQRAEELLPGDLAKWVKAGLGETYLGAGGYEKAVEAFTQAMDLAPEDDELVTRAMKGIAFAYASMGDAPRTEEALSRLNEKNSSAATAARAETTILLENRRRFFAASGADSGADSVPETEGEDANLADTPEVAQEIAPSETVLSDAIDRRGEIMERTPHENTRESVTIWDFTLGEPIQSVLEGLKERGIEAQKTEEPTKLGTWFYTVKLPGESPLPELVRKDADSVLYILEEFEDKLLSVGASVTWRGRKNAIRLKDDLFEEMSKKLNEKYGRYANANDNGIFAEASWVPDDKQLIALETTASLDGQVVLFVNYNDLPGLSVFWEKAKQIGER